ncbi:MAG: TetR/AcrR family transcriptional regulator [Eubacterium sp.]|nr:TetR/AcrR family transcriptional regulator [Eubacterium sp.]
MTEEFISVQDRIISASIDIISDAGLASLNFKNLSLRTAINESMLYKYYLDTNEILVDVVKTYFMFDKAIFKTLASKNVSYIDKIEFYVDQYGQYYNSYYSLSAVMLHYEELLHNTHTREIVESGYLKRRSVLTELFEEAIKSKEIVDTFSAQQLADSLLGMIMLSLLNRRVMIYKKSIKDELLSYYRTWIDTLRVK